MDDYAETIDHPWSDLYDSCMQLQTSQYSIALDTTDLRVLDQLQTDASLTNQALAERVHISPATCLRRVKRLVEAGVIERRVAILSPQRLGQGLTALVELTLDRQGAEHLAAFEARIGRRAAIAKI